MPFQKSGKSFKCKYCEKPAKVNYYGKKRLHKGYLRTCGSENCLTEQYRDRVVTAKKAYVNKRIETNCEHCKRKFIKTSG